MRPRNAAAKTKNGRLLLLCGTLHVGGGVFGTNLIDRYVELPTFQSRHCIDTIHYHNEALNVARLEPFCHLGANGVEVLYKTLVGRCQTGQTVLGFAHECFGHVNACNGIV